MKRLSTPDNQSNKTINLANGTSSGDAVNKSQLDTKQDTLVSGTSIKTVNGTTLLGSGNIATPDTTYAEITTAEITAGTASTARAISGRRAQDIVDKAQTGVVKSATTSRLTVSTTAPSSPALYDLWLDLS